MARERLARFVYVVRDHHAEQFRAVLTGADAAGTEGTAIAHPFNLHVHRHRDIAGREEIRMQRMRPTVTGHGPVGRRERLRQQLAAIHAAFALRRFRGRESIWYRFHQIHHPHKGASARGGH